MTWWIAALALVLGVVLIIVGAEGTQGQLFQAVTGKKLPASAGGSSSSSSGGVGGLGGLGLLGQGLVPTLLGVGSQSPAGPASVAGSYPSPSGSFQGLQVA